MYHPTCAGVVLELITVVTHAAVASWRVLTPTIGAGSLTTLVNVCREQTNVQLSGDLLIRNDQERELNYKLNT